MNKDKLGEAPYHVLIEQYRYCKAIYIGINHEQITVTTRAMVKKYDQPMRVDVEAKYKEGLISDRTYKILSASLAD